MAQSVRREDLRGMAPWVTLLLLAVVILAIAGCGSDTEATPNPTGTSAVTGQTGGPTSMTPTVPGSGPSGMPGGPGLPSSGSADTTTTQGTGAVASSTTTTSGTTATTSGATATTALAAGAHGDGIYLVGTDIDSGLYHGTVSDGVGHWEISSDANGDRYVASGDPTGPFYVKVKYGQYLRLAGAIIAEASTQAADPLATTGITDGTYRVGYDIAAGWYRGTVDGRMGYWEISSDANGEKLVASDYPLGSFTLKVKDGQYLTLKGVTASQ
jgi:hypothetical protein